jgi:hypothetical protein
VLLGGEKASVSGRVGRDCSGAFFVYAVWIFWHVPLCHFLVTFLVFFPRLHSTDKILFFFGFDFDFDFGFCFAFAFGFAFGFLLSISH